MPSPELATGNPLPPGDSAGTFTKVAAKTPFELSVNLLRPAAAFATASFTAPLLTLASPDETCMP
ncbi:MAG: hypothetical protein NTW87_10350 [Planctomycetota bacterium]|nr:hypothetical protein [Planctomycetota bacterium]